MVNSKVVEEGVEEVEVADCSVAEMPSDRVNLPEQHIPIATPYFLKTAHSQPGYWCCLS